MNAICQTLGEKRVLACLSTIPLQVVTQPPSFMGNEKVTVGSLEGTHQCSKAFQYALKIPSSC